MKKFFFSILFAGIFANLQTVMAQSETAESDWAAQIELRDKMTDFINDFRDEHNLYNLKSQNKLSTIFGQVVCLAPKGYDLDIQSRIRYSTDFTMNAKSGNSRKVTSDMELTIKKVKGFYATVIYDEAEYQIATGTLSDLMLKKDRDELLKQVDDLVAAAKKKRNDVKRKAAEERLNSYYAAIAKMKSGSPSGPIAVKVKVKPREYNGKTRFKNFYKNNQYSDFSSFLDEKFVVDESTIDDKYLKIKESAQERKLKKQVGIPDYMKADTFGIWRNEEKKQWDFINLRTGETLSVDAYVKWGMESVSYLKNFANTKPFLYDGKYSIQELLNPELYRAEHPEKLCEGLFGEKIYLLSKNDYDEISSVAYSGKGYKVTTKSNGVISNINDIISVKWYEELQKYVGKKVIPAGIYNGKGHKLYQEDLPSYDIWTVDKIEVETKDNLGTRLYMTCSKDGKTAIADAIGCCLMLTHDIDFVNGKSYSPGPSTGFGGSCAPIILSYEYVKNNAPHMSEESKAMLKSFGNYVGKAMDEATDIFVYQNMTLSQFRKAEPKAKQVKYEVKNGKAVRVYHIKGYEVIYVNNQCTSVTKL